MSTVHIVTPEVVFDVLVPTAQLGRRMMELADETAGIVYVVR